MQVTLSEGETKVPVGQLATHFPCERKKPGKHPVHCNWLTVEATLKLGILHDVHFAPHAENEYNLEIDQLQLQNKRNLLSHSFLLLSAIMPFVP